MNRFFTLLLAASCLTAVGQVTYPYNPDGNADGDIAVGDLQDFLVTYGNPFSPSEIMVGDSSLTYWVEQLSQTIQEQQQTIDLLQSRTSAVGASGENYFWPLGLGGDVVWHNFYDSASFIVPDGKLLFVFLAPTSIQFELDGFAFDLPVAGSYSVRPLILPSGNEVSSLGQWMMGMLFDDDGRVKPKGWRYESPDFSIPEDSILCLTQQSGMTGFGSGSVGSMLWLGNENSSFGINEPNGYVIGHLLHEDHFSSSHQLEESSSEGPCQGEFTVNYHGYDYGLVEIGDQCWFAENLQTTTYNNGDSIPYAILGGTEYFEWQQDPSRFDDFCLYDGFTGAGQFDTKSPLMRSWVGLAYSGYAAMNEALCPIGFRVPTTQDFEVLLGVPANVSVLRGDLLDSPPWGFGSNLSGFSARMHGSVGHDNTCYENGVEAKLLTSDVGWVQNDGTPHMNHLVIRGNGYADVSSGSFFSAWGRGGAIRCIKD